MTLEKLFEQMRAARRRVFMAHVYAGDPDLDFTRRLIGVLEPHLHILELGIPYSDPLADGPVFQRACRRALDGGVRVAQVLDLLTELQARQFPHPVVLTAYANVIFRYGLDEFAKASGRRGVRGLIVPDLPYEESAELAAACTAADIRLIRLITPLTSPGRRRRIVADATGFLYVVPVTGVTGTSKRAGGSLTELAAAIRTQSDIPLLAGFGISSPRQAAGLAGVDGFIMGSAICRLYERDEPADERLARVERFAAAFADLPLEAEPAAG